MVLENALHTDAAQGLLQLQQAFLLVVALE
jgi:hypothetical protein